MKSKVEGQEILRGKGTIKSSSCVTKVTPFIIPSKMKSKGFHIK